MKHQGRTRICILLTDEFKVNREALKYLVLEMNKHQRSFEFCFVPFDDEKFLTELAMIDEPDLEDAFIAAYNRFNAHFRELQKEYNKQGDSPDCYMVLTTHVREDLYYSWTFGAVVIFALGNWKKYMSPPSILELVLVLLIEHAANLRWPELDSHIETSGCLFDFNFSLEDVRYKALNCYVCRTCRTKIPPAEMDALVEVLDFDWLGDFSVDKSPAAIARKLGFVLFKTRQFESRYATRLLLTLRDEGVKELIKVVAMIVGIALLAYLGLSDGSGG